MPASIEAISSQDACLSGKFMRTATEYIQGLPKAELHVHIEGTLEPELAFQLAKKHSVVLPYASVEELRRAYRFADLQSFLDIYYEGAAVLRDADDFHALTRAYLRKAHAQPKQKAVPLEIARARRVQQQRIMRPILQM